MKGGESPFFYVLNLTKETFFYYYNMIVLQESTNAQTIKFIAREFTSGTTYNVKLINDVTGANTYNQNTTSISENLYYNQLSAIFNVKKENTYQMKVSKTDGTVIFKDKVFCTNQTATTYSVNESEYTSPSSNNDFIIL